MNAFFSPRSSERDHILDSGPLSLITNPKSTPDSLAAAQWVVKLLSTGHGVVVPAVADFEVRRELIRAGKPRSLQQLDAFYAISPGRFLSINDYSLRMAAQLWAQSRNSGLTTADPKELNADVIIAAQIIATGLPFSDIVLATTNIGHLSQFVPCALWTNINPS